MASVMLGKGGDMQPAEVIDVLVSLLSSSSSSSEVGVPKKEQQWSMLPWEATRQMTDASQVSQEEDMSNSCDFSSFPSLSLQKNAGSEKSEALLRSNNKEGVESHVASLLARPILVSNDFEKRSEVGDDDDDDDDGFVEESVAKVPQLMQKNLVHSFSTLVQSRLRAYATFLARHGLSLAATTKPSDDLEDGVVGVEQKLETLLEIGNLVALGGVNMTFTGRQDQVSTKSDEDDLFNLSMPLLLKASISVLIPTLEGRPECHAVDIDCSGCITGVFTNCAGNSPALRVVQVDLDMPQFLSSMKEAAASTVCRIVDMTNAAYSVPLPRVLSEEFAPGGVIPDANVESHPMVNLDNNSKKRRASLIEDDQASSTPDLGAEAMPSTQPSTLDLLDLEDDVSSLSPDKCGKIVDSLFDKIDVRVLSPRGKKVRFNADDDVDAIALTLPVA